MVNFRDISMKMLSGAANDIEISQPVLISTLTSSLVMGMPSTHDQNNKTKCRCVYRIVSFIYRASLVFSTVHLEITLDLIKICITIYFSYWRTLNDNLLHKKSPTCQIIILCFELILLLQKYMTTRSLTQKVQQPQRRRCHARHAGWFTVPEVPRQICGLVHSAGGTTPNMRAGSQCRRCHDTFTETVFMEVSRLCTL